MLRGLRRKVYELGLIVLCSLCVLSLLLLLPIAGARVQIGQLGLLLLGGRDSPIVLGGLRIRLGARGCRDQALHALLVATLPIGVGLAVGLLRSGALLQRGLLD